MLYLVSVQHFLVLSLTVIFFEGLYNHSMKINCDIISALVNTSWYRYQQAINVLRSVGKYLSSFVLKYVLMYIPYWYLLLSI